MALEQTRPLSERSLNLEWSELRMQLSLRSLEICPERRVVLAGSEVARGRERIDGRDTLLIVVIHQLLALLRLV